jgi:flagellar biosynthesis protein FlhG
MRDQAQTLRELAKERQIPHIITITSGKGGVGKTNLAANLSIAFSQMGKRVLLFDADLGLSNVSVVLGMLPPPRYNVYHFIKGERPLNEVVAEGPAGLKVIAGAVGEIEVAELSAEKRALLLKEFSNLFEVVDMVVVDTGAGLSMNILRFIEASDVTVLVCTPEPTSITNAYGMLKAVYKNGAKTQVELVINRVSSIMEGKRVAERFVEAAAHFLGARVSILGYITEDVHIQRAIKEKSPLALIYPRSKAFSCILHIRDRLCHKKVMQKDGFFSLVKRFFGF